MPKSPENRMGEPKGNSLSMEDFEREPNSLVEFRIGDRVTRENFLSLIIQSFAVSRGRPEVQWVFFEWLEAKYKFDFMATLTAFTKSGAWNALSDDERIVFISAFRRIKKHTDKWLDFEHEDEIKNELDALEPGLRPVDINPVRTVIKPTEVQSLEEFRTKVGEYFKLLNN